MLATAFSIVAVVAVATATIALLKVFTAASLKAIAVPVPVVSFAICFYKRSIGKLQLTIGNGIQLAPDGIVVHQLFVPGVISQLHVIGNGIGKA